MTKLNGFSKEKHLCSEKDIEMLYEEGKRVTCFPFRAAFRLRNDGCGVRLLIVARKKSFRHAVDRNRWRRMIREAFRVRQGILEGMDIDISIIVIDSKMEESSYVGEKMELLLKAINNKAKTC